MEADTTESERIDGTAQAGGPGTTIRKSADGNMGAGRKLSCDGIWARVDGGDWATTRVHSSALPLHGRCRASPEGALKDRIGAQRLLSRGVSHRLVRNDRRDAGGGLEAEMGYEFRVPAGCGVMAPYTGLSLLEGGHRTVRAGARWAVAPDLAKGVEAGGGDGLGAIPNQSLRLQVVARWSWCERRILAERPERFTAGLGTPFGVPRLTYAVDRRIASMDDLSLRAAPAFSDVESLGPASPG